MKFFEHTGSWIPHTREVRQFFGQRLWFTVCFAGVFFIGMGCQTAPQEREVPMDIPSSFREEGPPLKPAAAESWWSVFQDPVLDALVERAFGENLNLRSAFERLRAAEALADRAGARGFPVLELEGRGRAQDPDNPNSEDLSIGLAARYEVDLWGRVRASAEAETLRARATRFDTEAAALSLSALITRGYYGYLAAEARLHLLESQLAANEEQLDLLNARFGSGQIRGVDILRQRELVEARRGEIFEARAAAATLQNQLAVLVGAPPMDFSLPAPTEPEDPAAMLPLPPGLPPTGVPADLLRRRPDLRAAAERLRAADREYAAALADRYPRIDLSAFVGTAGEADVLFDDWIQTLTGSLLAPLFEGGLRTAEVERTDALAASAANDFVQAVLEAFREVEDALVREEQQRALLESLEAQVQLSQQSYDQLRTEYFNGVSSYLDVLTSLTDLQRLQRERVTARQNLIEFRINLYRALGGGIRSDALELPEPREASSSGGNRIVPTS